MHFFQPPRKLQDLPQSVARTDEGFVVVISYHSEGVIAIQMTLPLMVSVGVTSKRGN